MIKYSIKFLVHVYLRSSRKDATFFNYYVYAITLHTLTTFLCRTILDS